MDKELFNDLCESIKEAGMIQRGERKASRRFVHVSPVLAAIKSHPCTHCGWAMGEREGEPLCSHCKAPKPLPPGW